MARKKLLTEGEIRQFMKLANLRPIGQERLSEMGYPGQRDVPGEEEEVPGDMPPEGEEGDEDMEMDMDMDMDAEPAEGGGDMVSMDDFMSALERAIEEVTGEEADVSEEPGDEEMPDDEMGDMDLEGGEEMGEEEPMMEARKGHGGGARSDDPERHKRGKFGKPDEEEPDKYASGEGAGKGEKATRRSGAPKSAGRAYRGMDESEELDERRADDMRSKRDRMAKMDMGPGRPFGEPEEEDPEVGPEGEGAGEDEEPLRYKGSRGHRPATGVGMRGVTTEEIVNEVARRVTDRLQAENRREQMVDQLAERIMKRLTKK